MFAAAILTLFALSINLAQSANYSYVADANCGISYVSSSSNTRIVGGNETKPGEFPWIVSLQYMGNHMCGATIIDGLFALTAAHCFQDTGTGSPNKWQIVAGEFRRSQYEGTERTIQIDKIISHSGYSTVTNENDIALLRLHSSAKPYSNMISPICLADSSLNLDARTPVTVIGWGTQKYEGVLSDTLRKVNVYTYDTEKCAKVYTTLVPGSSVVPTGMMCAGDISGGKDSCQGDSGGPLMQVTSNGRWTQVGIVSWGASCGRPLLAGVYTKVATYRSWIEATIRANSATTLKASHPATLLALIIFTTTAASLINRF